MAKGARASRSMALWPVRLIVTARALTIGFAYYLVVRSPGETASFVAILGSLLTFDTYVALESRRHSLVGVVRALRVIGPRALATGKNLVTGLLVGLGFGLLAQLGLPYVLAAVATAGVAYSLGERTPNNISAYIGLLGALHLFERVAGLPAAALRALLPAVWPVAGTAFATALVALAVGLSGGTLMGFLTRLILPRAYRSRQSLAYPEAPALPAEGRRERVVREFWDAFDQGDFRQAGSLLAEDCRVVWPNTREIFWGRESFLQANEHYPGRWRITVEKVAPAGEGVLSVVKVDLDGSTASFYAVSLFEFAGEAVQAITEYWGEAGEPPDWRVRGAWAERY